MEGDCWSFPAAGLPLLRVHPAHFVTAAAADLVAWQAAAQGGLEGSGPLPFSGGFAEQPAYVIAAFKLIAGVLKRLPKKERAG